MNILILGSQVKQINDDSNKDTDQFSQSLHHKIKDYYNKNISRDEIPMWIELTYKYRREKIQSSSDYFMDLIHEFNYLCYLQYVIIITLLILTFNIFYLAWNWIFNDFK